MDWKILLTLLLSLILVFSLFAGCSQLRQEEEAIENIRDLVAQLPTVEEFAAMTPENQLTAYHATQAAYDAYLALSQEQREQLTEELSVMESLFSYFNAQIMPVE